LIVLGIETSCDETAAAICADGKILTSIISSQTIHNQYGGVVPELASREHERLLNEIVVQALTKAKIKVNQIEGIAVTQGPGLAGTLLTGVCFAKGLSQGLHIPIVGIHHLEAHIFANFITDPQLQFPFICLLVSGGHTQLWKITGMNEYQLLGDTRDDAAGEAFDKGARILGLGYPGGPEIEKLSKDGNKNSINFPRAFQNTDTIEFSFSGLKTALLYYMDSYDYQNTEISINDVAASYQQAIIDSLVNKLVLAVNQTNSTTSIIAGGVAANQQLRKTVFNHLPDHKILFPEIDLCTDNAAMIAFLGEMKLNKGITTQIDFNIEPNLQLN
jgi:N6-L-threonylcarbamoyladenine synthase